MALHTFFAMGCEPSMACDGVDKVVLQTEQICDTTAACDTDGIGLATALEEACDTTEACDPPGIGLATAAEEVVQHSPGLPLEADAPADSGNDDETAPARTQGTCRSPVTPEKTEEPLKVPELSAAPVVCTPGSEPALGKELPCIDGSLDATLPWHAHLQGPWETSRLGCINVVGEFVQCASGAMLRLTLAADGRIALSNWRADLQKCSNKLEWTRPDDPTGQDLVLWVRPAFRSNGTSAVSVAGMEHLASEEQVPSGRPDLSVFKGLQGRWDATRYGSLSVCGVEVRYDACDQSREPLRLSHVAGRISLACWRLAEDPLPDAQILRWTREGSADVITWLRMPDKTPIDALCVQRQSPSAAKQRFAKLTGPYPSPDRALRDRLPMQRLYSRALAFGVMPVATLESKPKPVDRQELRSLKKAVNKYQYEIEKLKKKLKRNKKRTRRERAEESQSEEESAPAAKARRTQEADLPPKKKVPRAKATAMKQLNSMKAQKEQKLEQMKAQKAKKLADASIWQKELAATEVNPPAQDTAKPEKPSEKPVESKKEAPAQDLKKKPEPKPASQDEAMPLENASKAPALEQKQPHPKPAEDASKVAIHQALSREQKAQLQKAIDDLDDDFFDGVLAFLEPELGKPGADEFRLDLDTLSPERLRGLVAMVTSGLHESQQAEELKRSLAGYC